MPTRGAFFFSLPLASETDTFLPKLWEKNQKLLASRTDVLAERQSTYDVSCKQTYKKIYVQIMPFRNFRNFLGTLPGRVEK